MPDWPTEDETLIRQFVNQLNLACYSCAVSIAPAAVPAVRDAALPEAVVL